MDRYFKYFAAQGTWERFPYIYKLQIRRHEWVDIKA